MIVILVEIEAFLLTSDVELTLEHVFGRVLGQFEIVNARVHARVARVVAFLLDHGETRMEIRQAAGWQRRAAGQELHEEFAFGGVHVVHDIDETLKANTIY